MSDHPDRELMILIALAVLALMIYVLFIDPQPVRAECQPEPITVNTPTGISGCEVWGEGIASHYGPGTGVAMNFCTWTVRHSVGCGSVKLTSISTGLVVVAPVVDYCDCHTGTSRQRIVDLQHGVVAALGLDLSQGLYPVIVEPAWSAVALPNTSMAP